MTDDRILSALEGALNASGWPLHSADKAPRLGLAVSGGLDSMVLLEAFARLRTHFSALPAPLILHFDHGIRPESAEDARFVEEAASTHGFPFASERTGSLSASGPSLEARARVQRYAFFRRVAEAEALDGLLLAHHRDDQRETVAHKLLRGSGPLDLAGMPAERLLSAPHSTRLLRPLISLAREDLELYAQTLGLRWREDASNEDLRHRRNRLRHRVLPRLQAGPGLDRLDRKGRGLRERTEALALRLETEIFQGRRGAAALRPQALALDGERLLRLPEPLARRLVERGMERLGCRAAPTPAALRQLMNPRSSRPESLELSPGLSLRTGSEDGHWWLEDRRPGEEFLPRPLVENGRTPLPEWDLEIHLRPVVAADISPRGAGSWTQLLPQSAGPLQLRPARREDRILPFGRREGRDLALAEYLEKRGVNASRRAHYPIVADDAGPLWPLGLPPAERARVAMKSPAWRLTLRPR